MTSLNDKKYIAKLAKINARHTPHLSDINLNTDDLEPKLDTLILNTAHNSYNTTLTTTLIGNSHTHSSTVDLGNTSFIHHIQVVGTTTTTHLDFTLQVSLDNVTFFDYTKILIHSVGTNITGAGDINFRYYRVLITNTHASDSDIVFITNTKNL